MSKSIQWIAGGDALVGEIDFIQSQPLCLHSVNFVYYVEYSLIFLRLLGLFAGGF